MWQVCDMAASPLFSMTVHHYVLMDDACYADFRLLYACLPRHIFTVGPVSCVAAALHAVGEKACITPGGAVVIFLDCILCALLSCNGFSWWCVMPVVDCT